MNSEWTAVILSALGFNAGSIIVAAWRISSALTKMQMGQDYDRQTVSNIKQDITGLKLEISKNRHDLNNLAQSVREYTWLVDHMLEDEVRERKTHKHKNDE